MASPMETKLYTAQSRAARITQNYNGDHDTMPEAPRVFWADEQNAEAIEALIEAIEMQQKQIAELKKLLEGHGEIIERQAAKIRELS